MTDLDELRRLAEIARDAESGDYIAECRDFERETTPEAVLDLLDEIERLREANESMPVCGQHVQDAHDESECWRCEIETLAQKRDELLDEINRLRGISNAFEIVKEQRDTLQAEVERLQKVVISVGGEACQGCDGEGLLFCGEGIGYLTCEYCGGSGDWVNGTGKRVPELEGGE